MSDKVNPNEPIKDEDIDFNDVINIMKLLDDFVESDDARLKLKMAEDGQRTNKSYHHGRCDVGSPFAKGTPFDTLENPGCQ